MSQVCPQTHYDFIKMRMPGIIAMIEERCFGNPDADDEMDFGDLHSEMVIEFARRNKGTRHIYGLKKALREFDIFSKTADRRQIKQFVDLIDELGYLKDYNKYDRSTFFFSDNLASKLIDTEVNVPVDYLTLPFHSCMFVYNSQGARTALMGAKAPRSGAVSVYLRPDELGETGIPTIWAAVAHVDEEKNLFFAQRVMPLHPGSSVRDAIKADGLEDEDMAGEQIGRIVANSILYLTSANPDVVPGIRDAMRIEGEYTKRQRRLMTETATRLSYTYVGGKSRPYERNKSLDTGAKTRALTTKVKVMGHWRNQAHGPNWSQHRHIHIEPYWKGDDLADAIEKVYRVR